MKRHIAAVVAGLLVGVLMGFALAMLGGPVQWRIDDLEDRVDELNCVHYIYEDGSAEHLDAETALDCLRLRLGWEHSSEIFRPKP